MRFKKKDLISLLEDINEMPMDFDSEDRPHDDIQRALSTGDTPLKKIPFPKTGEEPNKNFQELLASERYRQVVEKLRELTGSNITLSGNEQDMAPLIRMMQYAHNEIISAESEHKSQLIELAVRLAVDEIPVLRKSELETLLDDDNGGLEFNDGVYRVFYRLPDGSKKYKIQYDAKIVSIGGVSAENFNREMEKQPNSFVVDKIREITGSDTLTNNYGILMSINDTLYWQLSDDRMKGMMGGGGIGGKQQVKRSTKPPTVVAEAVNFPILVHELIKGTYEIFGTQGRPKDKEGKEDPRFADVEKSEDTLEKEVWDLRLGPAIYDRLRKQFPDEIFDDEEQYFLQNYLITSIFKLPAKQFLVFTKEVLSNSEDGKRLMSELLQGIVRMLRKLEYQQAMLKFNQDLEQVSDNINKTDLRDFLGDMGIRLSDDDDDPVGPTD